MPSKRTIILDRMKQDVPFFRYALWADVPAGNQIAYRNPAATSAFANATPAELQSIRDGLVAERVGTYSHDSANMTAVQAALDVEWTKFNAEVAAESIADYGRFSDSGGVWQSPPGVPMLAARELNGPYQPSYFAITPVSAFGANKLQFVLSNAAALATGQPFVVKIRLIAIVPGMSAVTGALSGQWTVRRRRGMTTVPSGSGGITIVPFDSAYPLPTVITAWNAPSTAPAGGSLDTFDPFLPQADEMKLSTADAPTMAHFLSGVGGQIVYDAARFYPAKPLSLRAMECLEIVQDATAGTGNCRVKVVFTV